MDKTMNVDEIRKWWSVIIGDNGMTEVRILGRFQYSGYFKSVDNLLHMITPYMEMDDEQCYFTLNEINDACYGRQQCEKFVKSPKATTTDNDIIRRKWLLIDFDPKRATGVNASEEEFQLAKEKAKEVYYYLHDLNFPNPIMCESGNGFHLIYSIDLPNTTEITETIKAFLKSLSVMFSDDKVDIDEKVFNAGRICKLYGTTAKKGANLPDRPWRESRIVFVPKELVAIPLERIEQVVKLLPKEESRPQNRSYGNESFNLDQFLNQHGISFKKVPSSDGTRYIIDHCFFDENHKGKDAVLFQYNTGAVAYKCFHQSCSSKTWKDVRLLFEPNAYDQQPTQRQYRQYIPQVLQKPKYEIKEEIPELGDKWLSLSKIKDMDLTQIEKVKTGLVELDRKILGLNMTEVTLLSGSNSSGKSSWLNTLLLNIIQQGYKFALWSGELPPKILKSWIQMAAAGKRNLVKSQFCDDKYYVPNNVGERIDRWTDGKFFLYNNEYGTKWQQIFADMKLLLKAGVKVFALDNLMSLDIDLLDGDKNGKQKELMLQIKEFAKKNNVHIILVAHPRKTIAFLRKTDISGSSDLTNIVDNCFIIHRVNNDFFRTGADFFGKMEIQRFQGYGNVLEVCKNRMWGVVDFLVGMHYEIESRRFKNTIDEDIYYGWEEPPVQATISYTQTPTPQAPTQQQTAQDFDMPFEMSNDDDAPF
jgi:archaellum biogenesis ATPase FlaH